MGRDPSAGTHRVDITPPVGSFLAGYVYPPRISRRVKDPLFSTAAVVDAADTTIAFVSCDLIAIPKKCSDLAKRSIREELGIPEDNVIIAATHIHTGPCTASLFASEADYEYLEHLPECIASSVLGANERSEPSRILVGTGEETALSYNRRYRMRDGSVRTNPGIRNPDVVAAVGPIDPQVLVLTIKGERGGLSGAIFNYSNHVDVLGGSEISSDYPGLVARLFRNQFGEDKNLVYLNGACGDLNHINVAGDGSQGGWRQTEFIGRTLFDDLLAILGESTEVSNPRVGALTSEVDLPSYQPTTSDIDRAREVLVNTEGIDGGVVFAREVLLLAGSGAGNTTKTIVQSLAVDDVAFVGYPGEVFVEIGLETKARSPFANTAVVELANDYVGYLPTDEAFEEGGYEVRPARSSRSAPGTAASLLDASSGLLTRLKGMICCE